jgi:hypothetical protein
VVWWLLAKLNGSTALPRWQYAGLLLSSTKVREKEKEKGIFTVLESTYRQANDTTAACKKELFYSRERLVKALFSFFFLWESSKHYCCNIVGARTDSQFWKQTIP